MLYGDLSTLQKPELELHGGIKLLYNSDSQFKSRIYKIQTSVPEGEPDSIWSQLFLKSQLFLCVPEGEPFCAMEKLKSLVPNNLKQMVAHSTPDDLPLTSSSLLDFFLNLQQFHQVMSLFFFFFFLFSCWTNLYLCFIYSQIVRDLAGQESGLCAKNIDSALELKQKGNQYYLSGDYSHALSCYTKV